MDPVLEQLVWQRAQGQCEYCQLPQRLSRLPFEIDHVIARKHRGRTVAGNLCLACFACNHHKGPNIAGIDPVTRKIVPLFHPRRHKWHRHFRWDGPRLVGLTAHGRATLAVLEINLPHRVALRRALIDEGIFPPAGLPE
jgi:5-methylcytosine-specific restriction endonuclease McrA